MLPCWLNFPHLNWLCDDCTPLNSLLVVLCWLTGDYANVIFSLLPEARLYPASGINGNLQWCGVGFKELPCGLGFGGQVSTSAAVMCCVPLLAIVFPTGQHLCISTAPSCSTDLCGTCSDLAKQQVCNRCSSVHGLHGAVSCKSNGYKQDLGPAWV
jgi:hypothetical protein